MGSLSKEDEETAVLYVLNIFVDVEANITEGSALCKRKIGNLCQIFSLENYI